MNDIAKLAAKREIINSKIKTLEKQKASIDDQLFELLDTEGNEKFLINPKKQVSIIRSSMKIFDMDKVYELIGNDRQVQQVDTKTGEVKRLELLKPNETALKVYVAEHLLGQKYKEAFYVKSKKPFIKIENL